MGRKVKGTNLKSVEKRIREYLMKNARLGPFTQSKIAEVLEYTQPSISEYMKTIVGQKDTYYGKEFEFKKIKGGYIAYNETIKYINFREDDSSSEVVSSDEASKEEKPDIKTEMEEYTWKCKARTADNAKRVSRSVVALAVLKHKRRDVIGIINSNLDKKYYYDIVTYKNGVYVLMNDLYVKDVPPNEAFLEEGYEKINSIYLEIERGTPKK